MKNLIYAVLYAFVAVYLFSSCADSQDPEKPNVVFIICDDLNDWVQELNGHPQNLTPNIQKLMNEGVTFTNAHSNNPICAPSRTSFLTGIYPHNSGYFGYNQQPNDFRNFEILKNAKTMMEHFYDHGYNIYGTGKIFHNGHEDWSVWKGYDTLQHFGIQPTFGPFAWNGSWKDGTHDHAIGMAHPDVLRHEGDRVHWGNSMASLANVPEYPADPENDIPGYRGWICFSKPFKYKSEQNRDKMPDELNVEYVKKILNTNHDKPFFLAVGFNRPHTPLHAPDKYFNMFPLDSIIMPEVKENDLQDCANALWNPNQTWNSSGFRKFQFLVQHTKPNMWKKWVRAYLANVTFVDEQVGKVLDALKNSEYAQNTIIVFTSDHGYHLGEKEYVFKCSLWEESSRVPMVISAPGVQQRGARVSHPVGLIDLYPTFVDLCGLSHNPNEQTNQMPLDGHSLKPFLENPNKPDWSGPDYALVSVAGDDELQINEAGDPKRQFYAMRTERYRYLLCPNGEEELYDHEIDPFEWNNLTGKEDYKEILFELRKKLKETVY